MEETQKKQYVIYLEAARKSGSSNDYGYYAGSLYTFQGLKFPNCTGEQIMEKTKKYRTYGHALSSAISLTEKCPYIAHFQINLVEI